MAQIGRNLMTVYLDNVVDAVELPTLGFATRPLSGLKCEIVLHRAEASLYRFTVLVSLI
jgi:hypothetical protein